MTIEHLRDYGMLDGENLRSLWLEIDRLRCALFLVMSCAGNIDTATDAEIEAALECGDPDTERQANAWLVARAALKTPNV